MTGLGFGTVSQIRLSYYSCTRLPLAKRLATFNQFSLLRKKRGKREMRGLYSELAQLTVHNTSPLPYGSSSPPSGTSQSALTSTNPHRQTALINQPISFITFPLIQSPSQPSSATLQVPVCVRMCLPPDQNLETRHFSRGPISCIHPDLRLRAPIHSVVPETTAPVLSTGHPGPTS